MPAPETPRLTVDVVIELLDWPGKPIVLIERRNPPHGWALPGGFVDVGEKVEHAAIREAQEETGLSVRLVALLGCYSDPSRDVRGHTASIVYIGEANGEPFAADDARAVGIVDPAKLPPIIAFDHRFILADYAEWRRSGAVPPPRL